MRFPWSFTSSLLVHLSLCGLSVQVLSRDDCCEALSAVLANKVSYPDGAAYKTSLQSYWSKQEQQVAPRCIILPAETEDVSAIIKILTATHRTCKFAIRSGGHTAFAGSANIQGGVTIDMSTFRDITLSSDNSLVTIGTGQRWSNVYALLEAKGLAVTGGRAAEVGVGGLLLGGGISFFAPSQGFSCDNVVSFEIVLADGSIVRATSTSHSDLWLALKGGSNNFGIVTRVVMRTFQQGAVYAGDIYYPTSTAKQQFEVFSHFVSNPKYDENAALLHNWGFEPSQGALFVNQPLYSKPVTNATALRSIAEMQPQLGNTLSVTSLSAYAEVFEGFSPSSLQELTFVTAFGNDVKTMGLVFDSWNASTQGIASVAGIKWSMTLQGINHAIVSKSNSLGGNSFGLPTDFPDAGLVLVQLSATWNNSDDSARVEAVADNLLSRIIATAKAQGTFNQFIDLNHANKNQNPIVGYGPVVHEQLKVVSRKYDPRGVFQHSVPGGFKL